ncbi:MAG: tRNA pseudouridine(55) synthase TruB [Lachnospiraceae bacterium]|nr:tRNA pseudouridine(55) synthase TruB [Lachnospiraceae bacterium]
MYNGIINIYKEAGFTSFDVIAKLRGILKQKKMGHTGTLDPEAVGVLPVCLGNGTKLCDLLMDHDKEYVAVMQLGVTTDTQDMTGQILSQKKVTCDETQLREAVLSYVGGYDQVPPMYSACKVNGKKLYELARQGLEIERKSRPVQIMEIEIQTKDIMAELMKEAPEITIRVACGKGTYIRTLIHDIGEKLGCGAAMKSLVRTKVGSFSIEEAKTLSEIEEIQSENRIADILIAVDDMFPKMPKIIVKTEFQKLLDNGNAVRDAMVMKEKDMTDGEEVRIYSEAGNFFGIYSYRQEENCFRPVKMFINQ